MKTPLRSPDSVTRDIFIFRGTKTSKEVKHSLDSRRESWREETEPSKIVTTIVESLERLHRLPTGVLGTRWPLKSRIGYFLSNHFGSTPVSSRVRWYESSDRLWNSKVCRERTTSIATNTRFTNGYHTGWRPICCYVSFEHPGRILALQI